jgi:hypothetical protein
MFFKMQAVLIGVHFVNNRTLEAKKMEGEVVKDSTGFKGNHFMYRTVCYDTS